jgi:2-dehydropantoate 2-reductase
MNHMRFLVFGAGAIGTYIGGSLAHAGNQVTFLEQPDALKDLRQRGLRLDLPGSQPLSIPPASLSFAATLGEAMRQGPFDAALFALKSYDTICALEDMRPLADQMPPLLCFSNGVDNEPALAAVLGAGKVIPATVTSSVGRRAVGDIVLERMRGIAVADGHSLSHMLVNELNSAGLNARLSPHPAAMKWSKLLTNLPANASAAILDLTAVEVFAHPGLFALEMDMLREALAVMKAMHLKAMDLPDVPVKLLALGALLPGFIARPLMKKAVGGGRGGKRPSFHIDLLSGRGKSEVEWLNGAVVRYGRKNNLPTPVNLVLTQTLLALTRSEIPLGSFSNHPELLLQRVQEEKLKG